MRLLAERVIAWEKRAYKSASSARPVVAVVCDKLRPALGMLMGNGGFRVLLARALARASVAAPALQAARVTDEGALIIEGALTPHDQKALEAGSILLIAEVLGLLNAFIGESLTIRFVRDAWPKLLFAGIPKSDLRDTK